MSEFNDFLNLMAEGKKKDPKAIQAKEIKENIKTDLGGLFSQMAEIKMQDPLYQRNKKLEEQIHEGIKNDLGSLFSELTSLKTQKEELIAENPELVDKPTEESIEEITQEILIEVAPLSTPIGNVPVVQQIEPQSNPVVPNTSQYDIDLINKKIKFIEQWVGKIQNAGPGGGEVNLRYLDDIDRSTIGDGKYLNYNASTKKFQFSTLSGGGAPQVQSDWNEADNTELSFIKNKPTLFDGAYDSLTGKPTLFSGSYTDLTNKPTIPAAQIQSDWTQTNNASLDYIKNKPTLFSGDYDDLTDKPTIPAAQVNSDWNATSGIAEILNKPTIPDITNIEDTLAATGEPMGHEDRAQSTISFNATTRTFTITPVAANFEVWVRGTKHTYTTAQSVTIPNTSGIYYIYFDSNGLGAQTDYFIWDEQAPTALVYYNAVTGLAPYFADERHGTTLDWQTHEYLHRTRGAVIANGFSVGSYTIGGEVQLNIANGTFFDEDLQIDVTHSNTPTANTWQQDLQGPAQIPMFYLSGTGWVRDNPTGYLNKQGTSRPRYNSLSGGVWSVADIDNNKYGTTFIVATNNLTYPIIGIMSQSSHANQGDAEGLEFSDLVLTGFPVAEFRLLYKVVFKADSTHGHLTSVWDLRQLSATTPSAAIGSDHGLLSGLGDDDHPQYLLRTDTTSITSVGTLSNLSISGDLTITGTDFDKGISLTGNRANFYLGNNTRDARTMLSLNSATGYYSGIQVDRAGTELYFVGANPTENFVIRRNDNSDELTINGTTGNVTIAKTLTVTGSITSNHTTAFIAGDNAISNVALQIPREGAIRNLYNGTGNNMYFDVSVGGASNGQFQFRSSSSFTNVLTMSPTAFNINPEAVVTAKTASFGRLPWNSALDTELTIDDYRWRITNSGGIYAQVISNTGGTKNSAWTAVAAISGSAVTQGGSTGILLPNNSWTTLYTFGSMASAGDTVTVTFQDKTQGRIYRITFMRSDNGSAAGYNIIAERLL